MVRRSTRKAPRKVAKPRKNPARIHKTKAGIRGAVFIGTRQVPVKVSCRGKITMTRAARKKFTAAKKAYRVKCSRPRKARAVSTPKAPAKRVVRGGRVKRVVRGGRAKRGSRHAATFSSLGAGRRGFYQG